MDFGRQFDPIGNSFGLYGSAMSAVAKPPVPPGMDPKSIAAREAAAEEQRKRSGFGRASTNVTGGTGDTSEPNLAAKSLLGQ